MKNDVDPVKAPSVEITDKHSTVDEEIILCKKLSELRSHMIDAMLCGGFSRNKPLWHEEFCSILLNFNKK